MVHVQLKFRNYIIVNCYAFLGTSVIGLHMFQLSQLLYFLSLYLQYFIVDEYTTEDNEGINETESSESLSSASLLHHQPSQTIEKDLIVVKF